MRARVETISAPQALAMQVIRMMAGRRPMKHQRNIERSITAFETGSAYRYHLERELQSRVGRELRERHADIMAEGVPPHFEELLARLDQPRRENPGD